MKQYSTTCECRNVAYLRVNPEKAGLKLCVQRQGPLGVRLAFGDQSARPGFCPVGSMGSSSRWQVPRLLWSLCFSCDVPSGDTSVQQRAFGSLSGKAVEVSIVRGQNLISRFLSRFALSAFSNAYCPRSVFPENKPPVGRLVVLVSAGEGTGALSRSLSLAWRPLRSSGPQPAPRAPCGDVSGILSSLQPFTKRPPFINRVSYSKPLLPL